MTDPRPTAVVRHGPGYHLFVWGLFPALGAVLGWVVSLLPGWLLALPGWVLALPILPGPHVLQALTALSGPIPIAVLVVLGAVAGAVLALASYDEVVTVEVDADTVRVIASERTTEVGRDRFGTAFLDGGDLVVLESDTAEVVRAATDHPAKRLRHAFEAHGYAWADGDPHEDAYRRWLDGTPELDGHVQALEKKDADDAAGLRAELAGRGIAVRDGGHRQYWRPLPRRDSLTEADT